MPLSFGEKMLTETSKIYLSKSGPFSGLCAEDLAAIRSLMEVRSFQPGDALFLEGDMGDCLYVIRKGLVRLEKQECGDTVVFATREDGDLVGELAVIALGTRFSSAIATVPTECYVLSRQNFSKVIEGYPTVATKFLSLLSSRIREFFGYRFLELETAQRHLEASLSFRERLFDAVEIPIIVTDCNHVVLLANTEAIRVFGRNEDRVSLWNYIRPVRRERSISTILSQDGIIELLDREDRPRFCRIAAARLQDESGTDGGLILIEDVTENYFLQQQFLQRELLAIKGEMAASVAHELKNHMSLLTGYLSLINEQTLEIGNDVLTQRLARVDEAASRMNLFIDQMLGCRLSTRKKQMVDLNKFLADQIAFLRPQRKFKGIEFKLVTDAAIPKIELERSSLQQIVFNVLLNAAEALSTVERRNPSICISTHLEKTAGEIVVSIADNGPGLDSGVGDRLFQDYLTTKPDGNGFGLMTVKQLIEECGGRVTCQCPPSSSGATFTLSLPLVLDEDLDKTLVI